MKMNLIVITNKLQKKKSDSKVVRYRSKIENQNARNMGIRNEKSNNNKNNKVDPLSKSFRSEL